MQILTLIVIAAIGAIVFLGVLGLVYRVKSPGSLTDLLGMILKGLFFGCCPWGTSA